MEDPHQGHDSRPLLVLDINGVLVRKLSKCDAQGSGGAWHMSKGHHPPAGRHHPPAGRDHQTGRQDQKKSRPTVIETKTAIFEVRPGTYEFLDQCFQEFHVAIWSSTTFTNANVLIDQIFTHEQREALVFKWFRDRTRYDPDYGKDESVKEFDTVKMINDIYDCPAPTFQRRWTSGNVLLLDDTQQKMRFNEEKNYLIIAEDDKSLVDRLPEIRRRFEALKK